MTEDASEPLEHVDLSTRSLAALEWGDLLNQLSDECASEPGRRAMLALAPARSLSEAQHRMQLAAAALELDAAGSALPAADFADISELLERLERGASAAGSDLVKITQVLEQAGRLRAAVTPHAETHPHLVAALTSEPSLERLAERLRAALEPSGEVSDAASATLASLRAKVRDTEHELRQQLKRLIVAYRDLLSGDYAAEREGRYVLPVRADAHRRVEGSVVGSSGSGNTLFVEPREIQTLANRLRVREAEAEREAARVLAELCRLVLQRHSAVNEAFRACVQADVLIALTRWSKGSAAYPIAVSDARVLELRQARHPLLARSPDVVANDLSLRAGEALVVSGPNAGGKTVALKTLGLFALMVRAGVPLPCAPESRVGFFDEVLADVGDQQSLVHSLSTFSGHVRKLAAILALSREGTLVLLDEIAQGTDPEEGAALAGAVLEALAARGAATAVTTHYERLKEQAAGPGPLKNACVGFDFARLRPTFRVTLGAFGPSSALLVAARYGIGAELIARARELLPSEALERERVAQELARERERLAERERELDAERDRLELATRRLEMDQQRFQHEARARIDQESQRLLTEVKQARAELHAARQRLRTQARGPAELRAIERDVSRVAAKVALGGTLAPEKRPPERAELGAPPTTLHVGDTVLVRATGVVATVLEPPARGSVELRAGAVRLRVPLSAVAAVTTGARPAKPRQRARPLEARGIADRARRTTDNTIDLRGTRVDEALDALDAFVDRLIGEGQDYGFVLHGHGTGALRLAVREHLTASTSVDKVAPADKDEGGDAFTVFHIAGP